MTRDLLANIETRHFALTNKQIKYFAEVFDCEADEIFLQKHLSRKKANRQRWAIFTEDAEYGNQPNRGTGQNNWWR